MYVSAAVLASAIIVTLSYLAWAVRSMPTYESINEERIEEYRAALRQEPDNIAANLGIAYEYRQIGRFDDALFHYSRVLELIPDEPAALSNRGTILLQRGKTEAGVADLRAALRADPGHELAAASLGEHYLNVGAPGEALAVLLPAIREKPRSAQLPYLAGNASEALGDVAGAIQWYRAALVSYPDMVEARDALTRLGASR